MVDKIVLDPSLPVRTCLQKKQPADLIWEIPSDIIQHHEFAIV